LARKLISTYIERPKKRRPGVHSKNASKGQSGWKKKYRGQGKKR
jgi:hypothetical protein